MRGDRAGPPFWRWALFVASIAHAMAVAGDGLDLRQWIAAGELPPEQRERLYRREARLRAMSPQQRSALQQRLRQWRALSPAERRRRREAWQALQALPAGERLRVQAAEQAFMALPAPEQVQLRRRFAQQEAGAQRGWWLGPTLGRYWPRLQPLLMQVPEAQRAPLLEVLRAMPAAQLDQLSILAARTPPLRRDRLRRELIATPAARRSVWLRRRLAD